MEQSSDRQFASEKMQGDSGIHVKFEFSRFSNSVRMRREDATPLDTPLDNEHHRNIVERFYSMHPELPFPKEVIQYVSWSEVKNDPELSSETLVFVDGGITDHPIDFGKAVLINDGGIIEHTVKSGIFFKDGGIIKKRIQVIEALRQKQTEETERQIPPKK